jgi:hypothetical protein
LLTVQLLIVTPIGNEVGDFGHFWYYAYWVIQKSYCGQYDLCFGVVALDSHLARGLWEESTRLAELWEQRLVTQEIDPVELIAKTDARPDFGPKVRLA